jgi:hypothetical protein
MRHMWHEWKALTVFEEGLMLHWPTSSRGCEHNVLEIIDINVRAHKYHTMERVATFAVEDEATNHLAEDLWCDVHVGQLFDVDLEHHPRYLAFERCKCRNYGKASVLKLLADLSRSQRSDHGVCLIGDASAV